MKYGQLATLNDEILHCTSSKYTTFCTTATRQNKRRGEKQKRREERRGAEDTYIDVT